MDNKSNTFLEIEPVGRLMGKYVVPCVISLLVAETAVGAAALLPAWFGLDGVLYSMPVSDALTFLICAAVIAYTYRALGSGRPSGESLCAK